MNDQTPPEMDLDEIDVSELQIETLAGDLRDAMLMRFRNAKRPWSALTEEEQRDLANGMEMAARETVRQAVRLLTSWEWPRAVVKLEELKIVGGDKAQIVGKIAAVNVEENRNVLGDHAGTTMMLLAVDSETFMGARGPAEVDPDQPELPGGVKAPDDGDGAEYDALLADKAAAFVRSEGSASLVGVQRFLKLGHDRAARIMAELERRGVVSPPDKNGKRTILRGGDKDPDAA